MPWRGIHDYKQSLPVAQVVQSAPILDDKTWIIVFCVAFLFTLLSHSISTNVIAYCHCTHPSNILICTQWLPDSQLSRTCTSRTPESSSQSIWNLEQWSTLRWEVVIIARNHTRIDQKAPIVLDRATESRKHRLLWTLSWNVTSRASHYGQKDCLMGSKDWLGLL